MQDKIIVKKTLLSLLPLYFCIAAMLIYILTMPPIFTSDGSGGVIKHSNILLQLTANLPILVASVTGSVMYFLILRFKNRTLIVCSWITAVFLGIHVALYLCFTMSISLWFFSWMPMKPWIFYYNVAPFIITIAFILVLIFFIRDSLKIWKTAT